VRRRERGELDERAREPAILWADCESTGLDTQNDLILEIALVVTDAGLNELGVFECVVRHDWVPQESVVTGWLGGPSIGVYSRVVNAVVREMHTKNGLFAEGAGFSDPPGLVLPLKVVEEVAVEFVNFHFNTGLDAANKPPLAGNTVSFDRALIRRWMPALHERIHYRSIDVSTLKVLAGLWGGEQPPKKNAHRALPDIRESIAELRWYRERGFVGGPKHEHAWFTTANLDTGKVDESCHCGERRPRQGGAR